MLPLLAAALQKFRGEGLSALDDLETELRRLLEWIHHERKDYWTQELHRAQEALTQARLQLQQATTMRRVAGHEPACVDERRALDRAKRRVETAMRKLEAVRHWTIALDRAADDFRRSRSQFATWLDTDLSRAVAVLNLMSEALVTYISMKSAAEMPEEEVKRLAEETEATEGQPGTLSESAPAEQTGPKETAS
jgi:hypothetical protein